MTTWAEVLATEKSKTYFTSVIAFVNSEKQAGKVIYPPAPDIFNALSYTPFDRVSVVILGQDPYHGPGQAHGLSFSVQPGVPRPPSLQNMCTEIEKDLGIAMSDSGYLKPWAEQGVLLLNTSLTVERGRPQSHAGKGWEQFTDAVITALNEQKEGMVFLLWGRHAQNKGLLIDHSKHTVLTAPHPSPLSAHRGFFGCKHFSQTNQILEQQGKDPINWQL